MDKNTVSTSELKARCAEIVGRVARTRAPVILTKRGRPVARILPVEEGEGADLFGCIKGSIVICGDIVAPLDVEWEAAE